MTVQQLIRELKKDATTYRRSGGGITLSGGEPLVQYEFAAELLRACKAQAGIQQLKQQAQASQRQLKR